MYDDGNDHDEKQEWQRVGEHGQRGFLIEVWYERVSQFENDGLRCWKRHCCFICHANLLYLVLIQLRDLENGAGPSERGQDLPSIAPKGVSQDRGAAARA